MMQQVSMENFIGCFGFGFDYPVLMHAMRTAIEKKGTAFSQGLIFRSTGKNVIVTSPRESFIVDYDDGRDDT